MLHITCHAVEEMLSVIDNTTGEIKNTLAQYFRADTSQIQMHVFRRIAVNSGASTPCTIKVVVGGVNERETSNAQQLRNLLRDEIEGLRGTTFEVILRYHGSTNHSCADHRPYP